MGTFMGHLVPGVFFLALPIWWTFSILNLYFRAKYKLGPAYKSSCTFPCSSCCCSSNSSGRKGFQWEGLVKLSLGCIGITGELITAHDAAGNFAYIGNGQHATMFAFFGFSGAIDLLIYFNYPLPPKTDYMYNFLCFAVEGILFKFHLHGRTQIDITVHTLLVYTIWACCAAIAAEANFINSVMPALARCYFVALQGTWFIQVGSMLYPPLPGMHAFDQNNGSEHEGIMLATIIFGWHMFLIFVAMLCLACIVDRYHRHSAPYKHGIMNNYNDDDDDDDDDDSDNHHDDNDATRISMQPMLTAAHSVHQESDQDSGSELQFDIANVNANVNG